MPEPLLVRALRREPVERTPVWFMRQAGRSLPEYRELRERHSFFEVANTPELCAEVTLQPVGRHGVDAAVLFADIVTPVLGMGIDVELVEGVGPVVAEPVATAADIERLSLPDPEEAYSPVLEAVRIVRGELAADQALVGFCGGPFTVAGYLIEGKPTRDFVRVKELMYREPGVWHALMDRLADGFAAYVAAQAAAGADVIQLFDSWVGVLSVGDYEELVAPYSARVLAAVDVPTIHFGTGTTHLLRSMAATGGECIGLDWRRSARRGLGGDRLPLGRAGQPRPGRAARAVGADRGDRAGCARPSRRTFRPRLQPRSRRPARDGSCGSVAAGRARPRANCAGSGVSAAVVLMAYGSPDRIEDVPAYYADIRGGRPVSPERLADLTERYRRLGIETSNPLNEITERTRAALEAELGLPVSTGMKHWTPRIADAAEAALATGADTVAGSCSRRTTRGSRSPATAISSSRRLQAGPSSPSSTAGTWSPASSTCSPTVFVVRRRTSSSRRTRSPPGSWTKATRMNGSCWKPQQLARRPQA